jgi:hypothetical protein
MLKISVVNTPPSNYSSVSPWMNFDGMVRSGSLASVGKSKNLSVKKTDDGKYENILLCFIFCHWL